MNFTRRGLALFLVLFAAGNWAGAKDEKEGTGGQISISKDKDAKAAPSPKADDKGDKPKTQEDALADIFGEGGGSLKFDGQTEIESDPETGEFKIMRVQENVSITGELMDIKCDYLMIDMEKQVMTARGGPIEFRKELMNGKAGRLTYEIETKRTVLEDKPVIRQTDENGRVTETKSSRIVIVQNGKASNITLEGRGSELNVMPDTAKKDAGSAASGAKEPARKIGEKSVDKIKAPRGAVSDGG